MESKKIWSIGCLSIIAIFVIIVISVILLFVVSIASDDDDKEIQQQVELAISNREYDQARSLAQKIWYKDEKQKEMDKINSSQLSYVLDNGSLEDAESLAKDLNALPVFWEVIDKNINKIYARDFRSIYMLLVRYPFKATYESSCNDVWYSDVEKKNAEYNKEVRLYNHIIIQIIDLAIFDGKTEYIKKVIPMLKPEAVEVSRKKSSKNEDDEDYYVNLTYKLENKAKAEALRKIKEAGINL